MKMEDSKSIIKSLEEKIQRLEEEVFLYKKIFENLPCGVQIFDSQGFSYKINNAQKENLQLPDLNEGIGKFNVLTDSFAQKNGVSQIYKKVYDTAESFSHEIEYQFNIAENNWQTRKDTRFFKEFIFPVTNKSAKVEYVTAILSDLTSQKHAQFLSHDNISVYKKLYENAPIPYQSLSKEALLLNVNKRWLQITGYTQDEIINTPITNILHPDSINLFEKKFEKLISEKKVESVTLKLKQKNGNYFLALFEGCITEDEHGNFIKTNCIFTDITELQNKDEALKASEMRWKFAIEGNKDGLWDWNVETNQVYFSAQWKKMLGYQEEDIKNNINSWSNIVHPEDKDFVYKALYDHLDKKTEFYESEHRLKCKDGSYKWILDRGKIVEFTHEKKPLRMIGTHTDISERKKIEEQLFKSQERFKLAMQATDEGIWDWDIEQNKMYLSPRWKEMLGYQDHEMPNQFETWENLIHKDDISQAWNTFSKHLKGETPRYETQFRMKHKNGYWVDIQTKATAIFNAEGKAIRIVGTHTDFSKQKDAQMQLEKREQQLLQAQQTAHIGHWELNFQTNTLYWSDEVYRIFGLKPQEFKANYQAFLDTIHPEDREFVNNSYTQSLENRTNYDIVHRLLLADGTIKYVNEKCKHIYDEELKPLISLGTVADITELVQKEIQISEQNQELKALNATKDRFFSIIAHDLRSPFSAILGFSDLIIEKVKIQNYQNVSEYAHLMYQAANQSYILLENLLQWSRVQMQRMSFDPQTIALESIFEKMSYQYKPVLNKKNINFTHEYPAGIFFKADIFMFETILRNLITNAIKYSFRGGKIHIKVQRIDNSIVFAITDNGVGISPENQDLLFKIDTDFTEKGTENEVGSGLGLILCKEFVNKHNGKIWFESETNVETTFFVSFPIEPVF